MYYFKLVHRGVVVMTRALHAQGVMHDRIIKNRAFSEYMHVIGDESKKIIDEADWY